MDMKPFIWETLIIGFEQLKMKEKMWSSRERRNLVVSDVFTDCGRSKGAFVDIKKLWTS